MTNVANNIPHNAASVDIDPLCPNCDYNLRDLRETRCPECGATFEWEAAHAHAQAQRAFQFEFQARRKPARSILRTTIALCRPGRFWRDFPHGTSVRPKALLLQFGISLLVIECLYVLALTAMSSLEMYVWRGGWQLRSLDFFMWADTVVGQAMPAIICAIFMYAGLYFLLRIGQINKIENKRLFRVMVYGGLTMLLYATTITIFSKLLDIIEDYYFSPLQLIHPPHLSSFAAVISLVLSIRFGIEHELPVRRPWLLTLSAVIMTAIAIHALIIGSGPLFGTFEWGLNPVITWFTYVMDPFWFLNW